MATVEEIAAQLGWSQEKYENDPQRNTDAATYILNMKKIQDNVTQSKKKVKDQNRYLRNKIDRLQESIDSLSKNHHEVQKNTIESQIEALTKQAQAAVEEGDFDTSMELMEKLHDLKSKTNGRQVENKTTDSKADLDAETKRITDEWKEDNPWYESDDAKTDFAHDLYEELVEENPRWSYTRLLKAVSKGVEEKFTNVKQQDANEKQDSIRPDTRLSEADVTGGGRMKEGQVSGVPSLRDLDYVIPNDNDLELTPKDIAKEFTRLEVPSVDEQGNTTEEPSSIDNFVSSWRKDGLI